MTVACTITAAIMSTVHLPPTPCTASSPLHSQPHCTFITRLHNPLSPALTPATCASMHLLQARIKVLQQCSLQQCSLQQCSLQQCSLQQCSLQQCSFSSALSAVLFQQCSCSIAYVLPKDRRQMPSMLGQCTSNQPTPADCHHAHHHHHHHTRHVPYFTKSSQARPPAMPCAVQNMLGDQSLYLLC